MDEEWISTGECARRHSVSRQAISAAVLRGDLPARKVGRTYIVKATDCGAWKPNRTMSENVKKRWAAR